jgi:hypothetical protein
MQADVDNDGAAAADLSMHECVDGLNRAEAARVFYQLLGTPAVTAALKVSLRS